ncbi:hypothetical protein ACHAO7_011148 [Fusarium culmorum]
MYTYSNLGYYGHKTVGYHDQGCVLPDFRSQVPSPSRSDSYAPIPRFMDRNSEFRPQPTIESSALINGHQTKVATAVDELLKAVQGSTLEVSPPFNARSESDGTPAPSNNKPREKRHKCNQCPKSFDQISHLQIHIRMHNGEKPYSCDFPGCDRSFSQKGNRNSHRRRHTGERPFSCDQCSCQFPQGGNLQAHLKTHEGLKPYVCILDECNKRFTQLGNMKTHQNKFHPKTLKNLTMRFAQIMNLGEQVPETDRQLFEYFAIHYKNSNKGTKGRGKGHSVAMHKLKRASFPYMSPITSVHQYTLPQISSTSTITSIQSGHERASLELYFEATGPWEGQNSGFVANEQTFCTRGLL